jgi:hypothetical protein
MYGKSRKGLSFYACEIDPAHHRGASWFSTHPKSVWIGEKTLIGAVHDFFADRIFGPHRRELLATQLAHAGQGAQSLLSTAQNSTGTDAELLGLLPEIKRGLGSLTAEAQRDLYDAFQLEIHYNRPRGHAVLKVTISGATVDELSRRVQPLAGPTATSDVAKSATIDTTTCRDHRNGPGSTGADTPRASHVLGAPGRSRNQGLVVIQPL